MVDFPVLNAADITAAIGASGLPVRSALPSAFDPGVLIREGWQATGTSIGASNSAGGLAIGASLGGISPVVGHCLWVETITLSSDLDITVWVQRAASELIANGAASGLNPVKVGPTFGTPTIPINTLLREGESISFILRTTVARGAEVPANSGNFTDTLGFRAGLTGRRVTNDFAFEAPKVWLALGDSITNTTGPTYGREFYHAQVQRQLRKAGKFYRRILKGDGGFKSSHMLIAQKRGWLDVPQADLITMMLGTNETALADFQANLPSLLSWMQDQFPEARKCIIGTSPRQDVNETSVQVPIRDYITSTVTALGDPLFRYTSLAAAFDRTDANNYVASDGAAGTRVHPNLTGHTAMSSALITDWQSGGTASFWSKL
jgi:lysophospholipase L1-like esterase